MTKLSLYSKKVEKTVKGESYLLYGQDGFISENMNKADVSINDIYEELRSQTNYSTLDKIAAVYMERTGQISFVKKV